MSARGSEEPQQGIDSYLVVRFPGDPTGYTLGDLALPPTSPCWAYACIGTTPRHIWIDVSKAYSVERIEYRKVAGA